MNLMIWAAFTAFFFQGATFPLGSTMILEIAENYNVDAAVIGYMLSLSFAGGGIAALCGSYLVDRWQVRNLIYSGVMISLLAGIAITATDHLTFFAIGMVFLGLGTWLLIVVGNYLIVRQYAGAKRSSQLNLSNFFFSLGALITPGFCGYALQHGIRWEYAFWVPFSLLMGLTFISNLAFRGEQSECPGPQLTDLQAHASTIGNWGANVYLAAAALGFYCILEVGYASWIVVHLREGLSNDMIAASMALTVFIHFTL